MLVYAEKADGIKVDSTDIIFRKFKQPPPEKFMENLEKYRKAFASAFQVDENSVDGLSYQSITEWDSVGHMALVAEIEDAFSIQLEMDDVIEISSFEKGREILIKYGVSVK